MDNPKNNVLSFLQKHLLCVIATSGGQESAPESALVAFVEDEQLCLYFQTGKKTRKAQNIAINPKVSFVIGLDASELATLQYEGVAEQLAEKADIELCKQRFLDKKSPAAKHLNRPETVFYKVSPAWLCLSDYSKGGRPVLTEINKF